MREDAPTAIRAGFAEGVGRKQPFLLLGYLDDASLQNAVASDLSKLTHVNLAFGVIDKKGLLSLEHLKHLALIAKLRAQAPRVRWVLSVGGWQADGFSQMARTAEGRAAFADSVADAVREWRLDGVDIDWEFPCSDVGGIAASPEDKENYTLMLAALRETLGSDRIVSVAVGAQPWFLAGTQMARVAAIVDYVQIMTYDLLPGSQTTGHHTALYAAESGAECVDTAVRRFLADGVPKEKIVIGAAFYGRSWHGGDAGRGLGRKAASFGEYGPPYCDIRRMLLDGKARERWDDAAKAPYIIEEDRLISFDSPLSVALKCQYVKNQGLLGLMYWLHRHDGGGELLNAAYNAL